MVLFTLPQTRPVVRSWGGIIVARYESKLGYLMLATIIALAFWGAAISGAMALYRRYTGGDPTNPIAWLIIFVAIATIPTELVVADFRKDNPRDEVQGAPTTPST